MTSITYIGMDVHNYTLSAKTLLIGVDFIS